MALIENEDIQFCDSSDLCDMSHIYNVLNTAITEGQHHVIIAMLVALQTLMKQVSKGLTKPDDNSVKEMKHLVWKLVCSSTDSVGAEVKLEACKVIKTGLEVFYPSAMERSALLMLLLSEGESSSDMALLLNLLLTDLAENITGTNPEASSSKERYSVIMLSK